MHEEVRVTVIATGFEGFELIARAPEFTRRERERETPPFAQRGREREPTATGSRRSQPPIRETLGDLADLGLRDRRPRLPEVAPRAP